MIQFKMKFQRLRLYFFNIFLFSLSLIDKKLTYFIIIKKLTYKHMCFIKAFCKNSTSLISSEPYHLETPSSFSSSKDYLQSSSSFEVCPSFTSIHQLLNYDCQLTGNLFNTITYNSNLLMKLQQNIDYSINMLNFAAMEVEESLQNNSQQKVGQSESWRSKQPIIQRLFGEKQYKYKLKLRNKFPNTIYKERNISLGLELIDHSDKLIMNSNMINICVAACQTTGKWISQNEEGEYFIQGKTQVQLYHGEAIFQKIYPRDVSRQYENGKIDVVIYPKPSLIRFSSSANNVQQRVNAQQIEPLLIKDVTIRAKKKSQ